MRLNDSASRFLRFSSSAARSQGKPVCEESMELAYGARGPDHPHVFPTEFSDKKETGTALESGRNSVLNVAL